MTWCDSNDSVQMILGSAFPSRCRHFLAKFVQLLMELATIILRAIVSSDSLHGRVCMQLHVLYTLLNCLGVVVLGLRARS